MPVQGWQTVTINEWKMGSRGFSVHLSSRWYLCTRKNPICTPPCLSEVSQRCLWNSSNVRLIDDGPLSSFQGRSSNASSFHASLLQSMDAVMSLALCPQVVRVALPASLSARSFPFSPACPEQYTHRSFRMWMSTIDSYQSGLPIPLFAWICYVRRKAWPFYHVANIILSNEE